MGSMCGKLFKKREVKVLLNGLDAAGKTTVLYRLKLGEIVTTIPTLGFNVETLDYKNVSFVAWDVGSRGNVRSLWRHYYQGMSVLMFVVDSSDKERIEEARKELHNAVKEDELKGCVFVIVANKQDLPGALTPLEIEEKMDAKTIRKSHTCEVFGTTATTGEGLYDMMDWVSTAVSKQYAVRTLQRTLQGKEEQAMVKQESKLQYFTLPLSYIKGIFSNV